jgi:hypothetical protein
MEVTSNSCYTRPLYQQSQTSEAGDIRQVLPQEWCWRRRRSWRYLPRVCPTNQKRMACPSQSSREGLSCPCLLAMVNSYGCLRWNRCCLQERQGPVCQDHVATGCIAGDLANPHTHSLSPSFLPSFLPSSLPSLLSSSHFFLSSHMGSFLFFPLILFRTGLLKYDTSRSRSTLSHAHLYTSGVLSLVVTRSITCLQPPKKPEGAPVMVTIEGLSAYFDMPLIKAASEMGICATALKKVSAH